MCHPVCLSALGEGVGPPLGHRQLGEMHRVIQGHIHSWFVCLSNLKGRIFFFFFLSENV